MPLTASSVVRVSLLGEWTNTRPVVTVWHVRATGNPNRVLVAPSAALGVLQAWVTHVVPLLANNYGISSADYVDLHSDVGSTGRVGVTPQAIGGQVGAVTGPNVGIVVRKLYSGSFRGTRPGRVFLPAAGEANIDEDGGVLTPARDAAVAALNAFRDAINIYSSPDVSSMTPVVVHTPSQELTETITHRVPLKDGVMAQSDVTGFVALPVSSGIQRRADGAGSTLLRGFRPPRNAP